MSNRRYERGRENDLLHWLRSVVELVEQYCEGRELIVGGPGMTKDKFIKELPARIKVNHMESICYTDENGLWELMRKERYIKVN